MDADVNLATTNAPASTQQAASPFADEAGVIINVLPREDLSQCQFWLGVFQEGKLYPGTLLDSQDIPAIFLQAATDGLAEEKPLMLSDSTETQARFFYFAPAPKAHESLNTWIDAVSKTIIDLKLSQLGIYIAPELVEKERAQAMLNGLLERLVARASIKQFHLYPGGHGSNQILNTALQLKNAPETGDTKIFVFH